VSWTILLGLASALVAAWLLLTISLLLARPRGQSVGSVITIFPAVIRLLRALYADRSVPRSVRIRVWIAIIYNVQPINLIPDFVPVVGFMDNAIVIAWALRSAVRQAGGQAVVDHWRGTPDQLELLFRVARLGPVPSRTGAADPGPEDPDPVSN
jgi:uncharacterized membrane protein YkvA (DUF1232 family)